MNGGYSTKKSNYLARCSVCCLDASSFSAMKNTRNIDKSVDLLMKPTKSYKRLRGSKLRTKKFAQTPSSNFNSILYRLIRIGK
jgi:hypothetical protein